MKIKSIELGNWGRYQKINISVDVSDDKNVILIRSRNNNGKTTLFYSIKYALYGKKGLTGHKNQHESYDWINRQSAAKGDGQMYVELFIEHEGKEYRLQRSQRFYQTNTGEMIQPDGKEELQIFDQENGEPLETAGREKSAKQNWINRMLIPVDVSQFFFFDGEDIKRYTDEPSKTVEEAILRVLGIKVLTNARDDLKKIQEIFYAQYMKKLGEASKDKKTNDNFKKIQERIKEENNVVVHLEGAVNQAKENKNHYTEELKKHGVIQEKIKERQRIEEANSLLEKSQKDNDALLQELRGNSSLLLLDPLLKIIDKTEENPPSKDQWESKIAKYMIDKKFDICVCGTHVDDTIKSNLEEKVLELRPNPQAELKRFVESALGSNQPDRKFSDLNYAIKDRIRIKGEMDTNNTVIDQINNELPNTGTDKTIAVLRDKEKKSEQEVIEYGRGLERAKDKLKESKEKEASLKRKLEQSIDSEEVKTSEEQKEFITKIYEGMKQAIDAYYKFRKPELEKYVSDVFKKLINNPKLYNGITVDDNWEMKVKYYDGTLLPTYQYGPSSGSSQIVATAFIAGLNKFAQKTGPVIIDTPLGRLDEIHRQNLLEYYNQMSEQVIILYTPTEINDRDQMILEDYVNNHYEIIPYDDRPDLSRIIHYESVN